MTEKQKLTLEKEDEEAEAATQQEETFVDLKRYTAAAVRRLSEGGSMIGDRAKKGWTGLISRARETQPSLQKSGEKKKEE